MKKTISVFALAALFVSCSKEAEQTPTTSGDVITVAPAEFYATLETPEPDTKTTLGGDNATQVLWESGDSISVWPGVDVQAKYILSAGEGTTSATFTSTQTVTGNETGGNLALYPYNAEAALEIFPRMAIKNVKYLEVQNYRENSWDKGAMPMLAEPEGEGNNLSFLNLAGVLRLTLKGTATIDSIRVSALGVDEYAGGVSNLYAHDGTPGTLDITFTSGKKTVTLNCGTSGVTLSKTEGTVFNIVIPPIKGGFKVAICDRNHEVMILQSSSEIKRNTILNMPAVEYAPNAKDLGLSVYWATCNVGATTPECYGDYFAWGETETYYKAGHAYDNPCSNWKDGKSSGYSWSSYEWCEGTENTITKYNTDSSKGTVDNKTTLDTADDVATAKWGSAWRMPTESEMTELKDNCTWAYITRYNEIIGSPVNGCRVTSKVNAGVDIFLPAAGYRNNKSLYSVGDDGLYWSSSLYGADTNRACSLTASYDFENVYAHYLNRHSGLSVRPVSAK